MEEMRKGTLFLTIGDATYTQRKNMPTVITVLNRDGKCRKEVRKETKTISILIILGSIMNVFFFFKDNLRSIPLVVYYVWFSGKL